MRKLINFQQYVEEKKKTKGSSFHKADYRPAPNCRNSDSYGIICVKCGKCGRKFD